VLLAPQHYINIYKERDTAIYIYIYILMHRMVFVQITHGAPQVGSCKQK
jgi:hypothetical protein